MWRMVRTAVLAFAIALLSTVAATAQQLPGLGAVSEALEGLTSVPAPQNLEVSDRPGDAGNALLLEFDLAAPAGGLLYVAPQVLVDGRWVKTSKAPLALDEVPTAGDLPEHFGWWPANPGRRVIVIEGYYSSPAELSPAQAAKLAGVEVEIAEAEPAPAEGGEAAEEQLTALEPGTEYQVQLTVFGRGRLDVSAGSGKPVENLFNPAKVNVLLISIIFAAIILAAIYIARSNPSRLFIRRIAGLEAVEEAIGRATEMGKPVMQINGLDPLTTLSTVAAVNILGQIARKVAHYDSRLMVPSFDPVVMTVSQETVKQAYLEEGRPDAYREDDVFFVTDQQFSYVATVNGLILRERPAAILLLGYFYAESLLLAETGQSTGAIQIAGTDAQAQLPFFITACDYTLIGEELYAASAYLAREPMLLGSLKGLDVAKVFVMILILLGTLLATFGLDALTKLFTPI